MNNAEIARLFRRLADLLELRGENEFKLRAYRNAAELIADFPTPLAELAEAGGVGRLRELPGIGEAISKKIAELLETGTFKAYKEITQEIPESVLDLLQVEGVGMKTLQILYHQFQLTNLEDFQKFVAGGGLNSVPRLGDKTQERIRASLERLRTEANA
jgi:DNA polymerase (family 10)